MKLSKRLALFLAFIMLFSIMAGCGKTPVSPVNSPVNSSSPSSQTVGSDKAAEVDVSNLDEAKIKELIASHTDANGKSFVSVAITDDPGSMLPQGSGSSKPRMVVLEGIFEGLFCIQGTGGELAPVLAEGYEILADGLTYRIKLKDYVYDSQGNHFTANDVYFAMEKVAREQYKVASTNYVKEVKVVDDYTVDIVFNSKMSNYIINTLIMFLFTQKSYEASTDGMITTPVGTGPYKLTKWVSGSEMVFEARDDYWEKDKSKIKRNSLYNVDKIIYKVIKDAAQRVIALEAKEVDICTGISATDLGNFNNNPDYNVFNSLQDQVVSLAFNSSENSKLQDVKIRQAIAYAIDKQGVVDGVDQGNGKVCYTAFCDIFPDFDKKWESEDYYNFNVEKAKTLLKEAGVAEGSLKIKIMFENNDRLANVAQVIQGYLMNVGIELEIFPCDGALFNTYKLDNTKSDILMFSAGSSTYGSSSLIGNLNSRAADKTLIGIKEDVLWDKITKMAENAYTDWSYAHDLHYYVKDNCYLISLYAPINFTVTSKVVTGLVLNQKGMDSPNCSTYIWNK